jgi:uncharacterized protein
MDASGVIEARVAKVPMAEYLSRSEFDLDLLDEFLSSDRSPDESLQLSDLDGFLTGIAVGPEPILPHEWLPVIWGGGTPAFADDREAENVIGAIFGRYNQILREIEEGDFGPVFWERDEAVIAADWAEGFLLAIGLRFEAWRSLFQSKKHKNLAFPILALCCDAEGDSLLGLDPETEDRLAEKAPDLIPHCVLAIAAYWRDQQ